MEGLEDIDDEELFNPNLQEALNRYKSRRKKKRQRRVKKRAVSRKRMAQPTSIRKLSVKKLKDKKKVVKKKPPQGAKTKEMRIERIELRTSKRKLSYWPQWMKILHDSLKLEGQMTDSSLMEFLIACAVKTPEFKEKFKLGYPLIETGAYKLVKPCIDYSSAVLADLKNQYCTNCQRNLYVSTNRNSIESIRNQIQYHEAELLIKKIKQQNGKATSNK